MAKKESTWVFQPQNVLNPELGVGSGVESNVEVLQPLSVREGRRTNLEKEDICLKFLSSNQW